jgi:hypothetical protein
MKKKITSISNNLDLFNKENMQKKKKMHATKIDGTYMTETPEDK